jgi:hypothetical protein
MFEGGGAAGRRFRHLDRIDETPLAHGGAEEPGGGESAPSLQPSLVEQADGLVLVEEDM